MKQLLYILFAATLVCSSFTVAAEEEGGSEKEKPKQEDKPRPDSVLSSVLALPVVKAWNDSIESRGDGSTLTAWGEVIKTVNDNQCWGVAVGKTNGDKTLTWKRFCVTPGGRVWVESAPDPKTDEITYTLYDEWVSKCKPTSDSPGNC